MALLVDRDIRNWIQNSTPSGRPLGSPPLASATDPEIGKWDSKIQPASLDLSVGRILLPIEDDNSNNYPREETSLSLAQGETAVVITQECLALPRTIAAVGFPPASVSRDGLLMTNPGHIDPGFKGHLKFTVINLGKKPIELSAGKPICTLLFFSIDKPDFAYDQLANDEKPASLSENALLRKLSKDFLSIEKRAKDHANRAVKNAQIITPIIAALAAAAVTIFVNYFNGLNDLKVKIEGVEKTVSLQELKVRLERLEQRK
jgi:dCTP deaminase